MIKDTAAIHALKHNSARWEEVDAQSLLATIGTLSQHTLVAAVLRKSGDMLRHRSLHARTCNCNASAVQDTRTRVHCGRLRL